MNAVGHSLGGSAPALGPWEISWFWFVLAWSAAAAFRAAWAWLHSCWASAWFREFAFGAAERAGFGWLARFPGGAGFAAAAGGWEFAEF